MTRPRGPGGLEIWGGVESSHLRVGDRVVDQLRGTGHASRLGDLDRLADLGVTAVRYPVLWGWGTNGQETNWGWSDARVWGLLDRGIRPVVGLLHHGFGPTGINPFAPDYADRFAGYAGLVAARYPGIDFLPINEPLTTARFAGLYGHWWPHGRDDRSFVLLLLQQILAIRAATMAIRQLAPEATVLASEDLGITQGSSGTQLAVDFDNERRWLTWDLLHGRVDDDHIMRPYLGSVPDASFALDTLAIDPVPPDVLGIDHYITSDRYLDDRVEHFPARFRGEGHGMYYADVEAVRVEGADIRPFARAIDETWRRYERPMVLAEVQLAGDDAARVAWWHEAVAAAHRARAHGVDLRAVTSWSVFGAVDWASLFLEPGQLYEPGAYDAAGGVPRETLLADAVRATALGGAIGRPSGHGWWHQPSRLEYPGFESLGFEWRRDDRDPTATSGSPQPI